MKQFLGTTDWKIKANLLKLSATDQAQNVLPSLTNIKLQEGLYLLVVDNLLSEGECSLIAKESRQNAFEEMNKKYPDEERNNRRLIVKDEQTSRLIWERLEKVVLTNFQENQISTTPLGFGVRGEWQCSGANPALRLNEYNENQSFSLHKDAQYAPNGDERSLCSIVIYLTDDFESGETQFYFPKMNQKEKIRKGSTVQEEINALGGLENGYDLVSITPKVGRCVLFSHNLIHGSVPPRKKNESDENVVRLVLRSDLLVRRFVVYLLF